VVVTITVAIPFAPIIVDGLTEHVVAAAGTLQVSVTVEEYPKKGNTPMSLM
jgi:hypothetical protein